MPSQNNEYGFIEYEARTSSGGPRGHGPELALERHYSVAELAATWNFSEKTVHRMFVNEPGVLKWGQEEQRHKRGYCTLRIPESVVLRVHRKLRKQ